LSKKTTLAAVALIIVIALGLIFLFMVFFEAGPTLTTSSTTSSHTTTTTQSSTKASTTTTTTTTSSDISYLTVQSVDMSGHHLSGLWITWSEGATLLDSGYTPITFSGTNGVAYIVNATNYQNYVFCYWSNGATDSVRTVVLTANETLLAVYSVSGSCGTSTSTTTTTTSITQSATSAVVSTGSGPSTTTTTTTRSTTSYHPPPTTTTSSTTSTVTLPTPVFPAGGTAAATGLGMAAIAFVRLRSRRAKA
jgi:hypothetical protein